ncbi:DUF6037 family protein [Pseudoalteromonas phenolica]|uniref:Uncharacterized protein n=1 Tax=Pseudoalteromonas phenolica TaxID=161398 RepID=A0A0S2K2M8_9GAMM|nr:DUF6037 family protein [Pseudoalteromonas phenolica]ALO42759.1 hypothetical protein PP2015_2262 [Pseudoalteromonas phenolica]MBE0356130.1 hypothetical protein [Pseudoalteromonas phenolica O-BC30]RXE99612.1 hypothetical protein D9981_09895 [Pseudoalteromonas phenolica O-BC30]
MSVFASFKLLKEDMESLGWVIEAFPFKYKSYSYVVLAKLYQRHERKPKFALMKAEFIRQDDASINKTFPVNSAGFDTTPKELREFFGIEYGSNIGDILKQFNEYFAQFIPEQVTLNKPDLLKDSMVRSLSESDSEDPNRLYCFDARRNGGDGKRTQFNDNKTRLLRPTLYSLLKDEQTVSFFYSSDPHQEESDEQILTKFSQRKAKVI